MSNTSNAKQFAVFVIPFVLVSVAFPFVAWPLIIEVLGALGTDSTLVGEPGGVDPGSVLVVVIYLACTGLFCRWLVRRDHTFAVKWIYGAGAVLAVFAFVTVSALIWH